MRKLVGLPIGVERTISLNRRLSEAEWEQLVVKLREVFDARGVVSSSGSFRQWTNGNLQALLEPTEKGHRLRLVTTRGASRLSMGVGTALVGFSGVLAISASMAGHLAASIPGIAIVSLIGIGAFANGALRLPSWARRRAQQMETIASQLALETGGDVPDDKASR